MLLRIFLATAKGIDRVKISDAWTGEHIFTGTKKELASKIQELGLLSATVDTWEVIGHEVTIGVSLY